MKSTSASQQEIHSDGVKKTMSSLQKVWQHMCQEAKTACEKDELINNYYEQNFVKYKNEPTVGLANFLTKKLNLNYDMQSLFNKLFIEQFAKPTVSHCVATDILAVCERDAACTKVLHGAAFAKGLHALLCHRVAHEILQEKKDSALYLQYLCCMNFSVDIHPAARIAPGLFLDHGDSIVIGETCTIDEDVSILQDVTLGGTGKHQGDRHPKIGKGVLIGAGAKILGNIHIGNYSRIGASSVVLEDVPARCTAVGVPARIIPHAKNGDIPSKAMDHKIKNA